MAELPSLFDVCEQDRELVAAHAGHRVVRADREDETRGHFLQQRVADRVPEGIVDQLELIEIEEHHPPRGVMALGVRERDVDAIAKEQTVGQAGQRIVVGLILHLLLRRLAIGDVDDRSFENAAVEQGHVLDDPDRRSVAPPHAHFDVGERSVLSHLRHQAIVGLPRSCRARTRSAPETLHGRDSRTSGRWRRCRRGCARRWCCGKHRPGCARTEAGNAPRSRAGRNSAPRRSVTSTAIDEPRPPSGGDEFEGDDLGVEDVAVPFAMLEDARVVAVAPRRERASQRIELLGRTDVFDRHPQKFVLP